MRADHLSVPLPLGGLLALSALCAAVLLALLSPPAQAATCSNESIRAEQGPAALALPGCRAYELVSPGSIPSLTTESIAEGGTGKASPDGSAVSFFSRYPAQGSLTSSETWLSRRTADGWTVKSLDPQMTPNRTKFAGCNPGIALSEDLGSFVLSAGGNLDLAEWFEAGECARPAEELVPGEPRGYSNLYLRSHGGPYQLVNPAPAGVPPGNATFQAASSDLSRIVFSEDANLLTPPPPTGTNLYVWADGTVRAIGVLPSGEHVPARLGAATRAWGSDPDSPTGWDLGLAPVSHAVSADGERVFFEANGKLYLRENATRPPAAVADCWTTSEAGLACTRQLDRSFGASPEGGGGVFQFASRNGDRVFFTSDQKLRAGSSAEPGKPALYEYRLGTLRPVDLTLNSAGAPNVRGISGGSDDGSHLYFVARGVLTGSEQNSRGEQAQLNQPNLYLVREGSLTYVATLSPWETHLPPGGRDHHNWWEADVIGIGFGHLKTSWSPSGRYLLFSSFKSLTGSDNTPAAPGLCNNRPTCEELFLYDAEANVLSCVSCDDASSGSLADTRLPERKEAQRFNIASRYLPRSVLDTGQVFFETVNPLSPRDVNGVRDVYEYSAGRLHLISSGKSTGGSGFIDATPDGSSVFFATAEALVRSDRDGGLPSVYAARINGGFAEPPPPPAPCAGEDCRPPGPPPPAGLPPVTTAFAGSGNVRPRHCKRGQVRRKGRCVRRQCKRDQVRRKGRCVRRQCKRSQVRRGGRCVKKVKRHQHQQRKAAPRRSGGKR